MKKAILLTGFFILIFGFPSPASAAQYQSSFSINCVTDNAGICTTGGPLNSTSVTGQAFTINGFVTATNYSFRVDMCISTTSLGINGVCTSFFTNGGRSVTIPAGDTTAYRWGKALVNINRGPTIIDGDFTVTGRVVEIFTVNDSPDPIQINQSSTITYSGADAWSCSIAGTHPNGAPFSSPVPCNSGSYLYINNGSSGTANYTVTFTGPNASGNPTNVRLSGTITVNSPGPTVDIRCNGSNGPCNIPYDGSVTLSWTSSGATSCTGDWPAAGTPKPFNGSEVLNNLTTSRTYTFQCTNGSGTASDAVTVNVSAPPPPTVNLLCNGTNGPCSAPSGSTVPLSWTSTNATSCVASSEPAGWSGSKSVPSGSESSPPITQLSTRKIALDLPAGIRALWHLLSKKTAALFHSGTALAAAGDNSVFISQSVPSTMNAGQTYSVSITMRNTGPNTWTSATNYKLGSQNPQDNIIWGCGACGRVLLAPGDAIATNQQKTFSFNVTAPSTPGTYNFQWRMLQEGVNWFGAYSTNVAVNVQPIIRNFSFVSQSVPTYMRTGQSYPVSITVQNTGNTTWTSALGDGLGSWNPPDNFRWGMARVYLNAGESIAPGQQKTFSFTVTAPSPGVQNFQWGMVEEAAVTWFGPQTPNLPIQVLNANETVFVLTCTGPGGTAWDPVIVQAAPNQPPVTSNVRVVEPNYCASGPVATIQWGYSDPEGSPQSAYQMQIDTDPLFGSPDRDTGKRAGSQTSWLVINPLAYNTIYRARVRTWDASDTPSAWTVMSLCTGPGCQPGNTSWRTPPHAYPSPINFTWTPSNPQADLPVTFVHDPALACFGGCSYSWTFGDSGTSTDEAPEHPYDEPGSYTATFSASDSDGHTCPSTGPLQKTVNVGAQPVPQFKEVLP